MLALPGVVLAHQLEGRRQHPLVVGQVDGALLEVDVQAVETVGFHQADDLGGQRLLLPGVQLDVRIGAPSEISTARPWALSTPTWRRNSASDRLYGWKVGMPRPFMKATATTLYSLGTSSSAMLANEPCW